MEPLGRVFDFILKLLVLALIWVERRDAVRSPSGAPTGGRPPGGTATAHPPTSPETRQAAAGALPPPDSDDGSGAAPIEIPVGAVAGDGSMTCPDDYPVKGNPSSLIYHLPGQLSYDRFRAGVCFSSPEAAEAAGYRASNAPSARNDDA